MKEVYVDLKEIASGMEREDLLKMIAAFYLDSEYGVDTCDCENELDDMTQYIDNSDNFLNSIENTLANIDREYDEDDYDCEDDYDEDDCDDDCEDDCEECTEDTSYIDYDTQCLIEANRRKNEQALGL